MKTLLVYVSRRPIIWQVSLRHILAALPDTEKPLEFVFVIDAISMFRRKDKDAQTTEMAELMELIVRHCPAATGQRYLTGQHNDWITGSSAGKSRCHPAITVSLRMNGMAK